MKKLFILAALLFAVVFSNTANSQSSANYTFATNTTGSLTDMSSGTTQIVAAAADDAASTIQNIGFEFWFMGVRYTQYSASSNGFVRLGGTAVTTTTYTLAGATAALIASYGSDLVTNAIGTGGVFVKMTGSAPNRILTIEFRGMTVIYDAAGATADGTSQVRLYETSNVVELVYGSMRRNASTGFNAGMDPQWVGFSTSTTSYATVVTATDALSTSGGATSNQPTLDATIAELNSGADGSRKVYSFTPSNTTDATDLSFTAVSAAAMTLNWTDNASDDFGYAIYRSDDGGTTYNYITKTAASATSYAATGLSASTTYFWRVAVVREGVSTTPLVGSQMSGTGSFSGTKSIGPTGDFLSLTAAITNIKSNFMGGDAILELQPTYLSAVETYPLDFSALAASSGARLTIRPASGATGLTISGGNTTALINISNPYITIDGRAGGSGASQLTISNTSAGPTIRFINDGNNSTVKYCTITGIITTTTSGVVLFSTSTGITGNSNNTIDNNTIRAGATNPSCLIGSVGTAAAPNANNTITNNTLFNFTGLCISVTATGNGNNWTISNNNIYNTITGTLTQAGISLLSGGSGNTIANNTIGGNALGGGGVWTNTGNVAVNLINLSGSASITGNNIGNVTCSNTGTTVRNRGILTAAIGGGSVISNNTIHDLLCSGTVSGLTLSSQAVCGIQWFPAAFETGTISGNTIYNLSNESTSANTVTSIAVGIAYSNSIATITGNKIYNIKNKMTGVTAGQPPIAAGFLGRFTNPGNLMANNMVALGSTEATNTQFIGAMVLSLGTVVHNYYYNSFVISGTSGGTWSSYGFLRGDNTAVTPSPIINLANNICYMSRTGGGSVNYAVGNQGTTASTGWNANYNLLYNSDNANVGFWNATGMDFATWKTTSAMDANSLSPSSITAGNLFTDISTGDLHVIGSNPEAWYSNGLAYPVAGISTDFDGNARSTTLAGGATDLGADEFTISSTPPSTLASGAPANSTTTTYTLGGKTIGSLAWGAGGTVPSAMDVVYYPGVNPPGAGAFPVANGYLVFTATGGSGYSYDVTINYDENQLGGISAESDIIVAKSEDNGGVYVPYLTVDDGSHAPGMYELNTTANTIKVYGLTSFSTFALGDKDNPLPVELSSFTSSVNRNAVELTWTTVNEQNNSGFNIERKEKGSNNWVSVGNVTGNGTTTIAHTYNFSDRNLPSSKYNYRLKQIDFNGNFAYHNLSGEVIIGVPSKFDLTQNYPNPFNPSTKINYELPFDSKVAIKVFDITGREMASIVNQVQVAGYYTANFNGANLSSGIYFYTINAEGGSQNFTKTLKMMLIK